MILGAKPAVA